MATMATTACDRRRGADDGDGINDENENEDGIISSSSCCAVVKKDDPSSPASPAPEPTSASSSAPTGRTTTATNDDMPPPSPPLLPNATRIRDADGFVGTIAYVGPVASAKSSTDIYAGIVWDDTTRGKHDGSVVSRATGNLVRHFTAPSVTGGSFIRVSKLDTGVALTEALVRQRYVPHNDPNVVAPDNVLRDAYANTAGGRTKPIEFHGELKLRTRQQPDELTKLSLRGLGISRSSEEHWGDRYDHVKELDLAGNLLSDWTEVVRILNQFPSVEKVSLSSNRIRDVPKNDDLLLLDGASSTAAFARVRVLNLNNCSIATARTVVAIGKLFPNVEELCLAHADLSDLHDERTAETFNGNDDDGDTTNETEEERRDGAGGGRQKLFHRLKMLDLSDCKLNSWQRHIDEPFRTLPRLETLILNDNPLPSVVIPPTPRSDENGDHNDDDNTLKDEKSWSNLTSIHLSGTSISSWSDLDDLRRLPNLRSIRFRNAPLSSSLGVGEVRSAIIARLPKVECVNASPVSDRERTEAERRYVGAVARELLLASTMPMSSNGDGGGGGEGSTSPGDRAVEDGTETKRDAILASHPRFEELAAKHKEAMVSASSSAGGRGGGGPGSLGHDAVNVTVRSMAASSCNSEPLRRRLPGSLKVGRLKALCSRAFGLDPELQRLHFRAEGDPFPTELDDDENTLSYYGVSDGAEVLMNEIDVVASERENERRAAEHRRRIDEQERLAEARRDALSREKRVDGRGAVATAAAV